MRTVLEKVGGGAAFIPEVSGMVGSEAHPSYLRRMAAASISPTRRRRMP